MKILALRVFVGWDPREGLAYRVCSSSLRARSKAPIFVYPLKLEDLRKRGLYTRPHETRDGLLWDLISDRPMSTQFALSRFLVPLLAERRGWALYCDCDFLWREDVCKLFALAEPQYAVMVVKHAYYPAAEKMDAQRNVRYARKNWSSLMLFNCEHPANRQLSAEMVNTRHRDFLHGFGWLDDALIGGLPFEWNWLELNPKAVHFTNGSPDVSGYEGAAYAQEWRSYT